jgi:hypothetical protein
MPIKRLLGHHLAANRRDNEEYFPIQSASQEPLRALQREEGERRQQDTGTGERRILTFLFRCPVDAFVCSIQCFG